MSWAIPKGLPPDKGMNHLAVHVEDHPLEYGGFEGEIPEGEYGAGTVRIWDRGTYDELKWTERKVEVHLHGEQVDGRFALFQTKGDQWMIHRMDPAPAGWEPLPALVRPMLADRRRPPAGRRRTGHSSSSGTACGPCRTSRWSASAILSRNDRDITASYPELRELGAALGSRPAVLDGEIVALDARDARASRRSRPRMHVADVRRARRLAAEVPVVLMLFESSTSTGARPWSCPMTSVVASSSRSRSRVAHWATPKAHRGPGAAVWRPPRPAASRAWWPSAATAPYRPGRRDGDWVKVKTSACRRS